LLIEEYFSDIRLSRESTPNGEAKTFRIRSPYR
jgi:hypothetical protein